MGQGVKGEIDIQAARELVRDGRLWPRVLERCFCDPDREPFFHGFPKEDGSRLALLDAGTRTAVGHWLEVIARAGELRGVMDGVRVRELKAKFAGAYPEALRYAAYFSKWRLPTEDGARILATAMRASPAELLEAEPLEGAEVPLEAVWKLLKLRFPEAYELCCS